MYRAPVDEIAFTIKHIAKIAAVVDAGTFGEFSDDLLDAILSEAGKFANGEIAPLYKCGDQEGASWMNAVVTTPMGWKELYGRWREAGWNSVTGPQDFGGQGLPTTLGMALMEMWSSGSIAFCLGPMLTMGAVEAVSKHGSEALKATYMEKLVSGEWMGTMNLTEPQAGSDLAALRARAERVGDGTYRIFGQKIFITFGEHDFTRNICHLVLARLPDAPAGTRGISLFLVPKFIPNADGTLGHRNDVFCASIEHKLGIHGSPTCTMIYGDGFTKEQAPGAIGWLVGEENKGLACMFTMMNNARLSVGIQGVGVAEAAFQHALAYANERRQGKASGYEGTGMAPIVYHPDVQRNLLTMKSLTQSARAICYACAVALDLADASEGEQAKYWQERANLLTPVAKAFATEIGVDVASMGVQVHGGMGYIEEAGAASFLRDSYIAPIYEGTNGIQAIDLVTRKLSQSGGKCLEGYIAELRETVETLRELNSADLRLTSERLTQALDDLESATEHLTAVQGNAALAGATPYLRLFGLAAGGCYLARGAIADATRIPLCRFFAENLIAETGALKDRVICGAVSLAAAGTSLIG